MTAETKTGTETARTTGCCGGGACGTGSADVQIGGVTTVYQVTGMTCGHCEGAVSSEISGLPGVVSVKAVASTGQVTVISEAPLDDAMVREAVDEAGYELVGQV
ncbi:MULTISPECIES: cation transporter [unclassified Streptomyces]|uniref:heavy-metal-associated domain-containing protein n=1 Tax=unclassified Streptomyces TaxID=2593676 RepID=UPI002DD96249|nr:cation transporter [Streptomyces sp. NBC_01750]WSB02726.1 cation transporter [Streptomyces sp. NBC_01794]WSD33002.1 cation transporter [Streptomyces sp. NBC_01750]